MGQVSAIRLDVRCWRLILVIDIDMRNAMLVSRIACLGKIRHEQKPYSGTLSRHLLAYQSMTSSIRSSLRDLLEMTLVALFLEGLVDRDRDDWMDLSLRYIFCIKGPRIV